MKPFNLEEALAGKLCITRDGKKVRLIFDKSELNVSDEYPIVGYVFANGNWSNETDTWTKNGRFRLTCEDSLDLIEMWEDKQPQVTITIPAPLKEAKDGQEVYHWGFNPNQYYSTLGMHLYNIKFKLSDDFHYYLLNTGQLFATAEDAQAFLDAMKGARR